MVDCRSLIEFCRAFERHKNMPSRKRIKSVNPLSHPFCEHSPFVAIDIVILLFALFALAFLTFPYIKFIIQEVLELLPITLDIMVEVIYHAPIAYACGSVFAFISVVVVWEIIDYNSRKCGNPDCKGLKKAVEFDIQLESEDCAKCLPAKEEFEIRPLELGKDHKELEAELKKMAPLNGRTVLIFRARCGCPLGRMEVWGNKKVRRIKK